MLKPLIHYAYKFGCKCLQVYSWNELNCDPLPNMINIHNLLKDENVNIDHFASAEQLPFFFIQCPLD